MFMLFERYLQTSVFDDLAEEMVVLTGPRGVGKTTLAKQVLTMESNGLYLSWDDRSHRRAIMDSSWPEGEALLVLDELHKWRRYKKWLRDEIESHGDRLRFLVVQGGELEGQLLDEAVRSYRLHPYSVGEIAPANAGHLQVDKEIPIGATGEPEALEALLETGGFPKTFAAKRAGTRKRWRRERLERFFGEDVRDVAPIRDWASLELFAELIPKMVGKPLSLNTMREDLGVSHRALTHWMGLLQRLFFVFQVRPYAAESIRALTKLPKVYLWDWTLVSDPKARYENLVAVHLLKLCHYFQDRDGLSTELYYIRDRNKREVDFLVTWGGQPWFAVQTHLTDHHIRTPLRYFTDRLQIPWAYQLVRDGQRDYVKDGIRSIPADRFLPALV